MYTSRGPTCAWCWSSCPCVAARERWSRPRLTRPRIGHAFGYRDAQTGPCGHQMHHAAASRGAGAPTQALRCAPPPPGLDVVSLLSDTTQSCIATSSRRTSSSPPMAGSCWRTLASPARPARVLMPPSRPRRARGATGRRSCCSWGGPAQIDQ